MPPPETLGVALVLLAFVLFVLEVKAPGLGALGVGGVLALAAGLYLLLGATPAAIPAMLVVAIPLAVFVAVLAILAQRARHNKIVTGDAGMVGLEGRAETDLVPGGRVLVRGELWDAVSPIRLERGHSVIVTGVRGLRLEVESAAGEARPSPPHSVVAMDGESHVLEAREKQR